MRDSDKLSDNSVDPQGSKHSQPSDRIATGSNSTKGTIGVLTTWNQECGLATYAGYMLANLPEDSYVVLAEETDKLTAADQNYVKRCWNRDNNDYARLLEQVTANNIRLLHINGHYRFFEFPAFGEFLNTLSLKGIPVVFTLHSAFTKDNRLSDLVNQVDMVITHTPEVRLETIANGAIPEKVIVVPHGVQVQKTISETEKFALKRKLGMPVDQVVLVSFGFVQPHKGMDAIIGSVMGLREVGISATGYIAGKPNPSDPSSIEHLNNLQQLASRAGVGDKVVFLNKFLNDQEVTDYLQAADLVILNYQSQHYEASGACSLAVGSGALVATSVAPPFAAFGDAVWHITSGYPADLSAALLMSNSQLAATIRANARKYCEENSWQQITSRIENIYCKLGVAPSADTNQKKRLAKEISYPVSVQEKELSVLIRNRPNALTQPGGDTIVMQRLISELETKGVKVTLDLESKESPVNYDLVHIFNFATTEITRSHAQQAKDSNTPYVVTTLCEDAPAYRNQAITMAQHLIQYVAGGQDRSWYQLNMPDLLAVEPASIFDNQWTVNHASALLTNGLEESAVLKRDYDQNVPVIEVPLGFDRNLAADPELFVRKYGVRDFVLCVGRLEFRKNQLMLLKALEESDVTVVLAAGGFSYDQQYADAVKRFSRRGQTIITERLSDSMLASAFAAARVHALPSWYELPGLVSLEAAYHGCAIVASTYGTSKNYLGKFANYCDPADADSVRIAVENAFNNPLPDGLKAHVEQYTWQAMGSKTIEAYMHIQSQDDSPSVVVENQQPAVTLDSGGYDLASGTVEFQELLEKGELAAKQKEYNLAHDLLFRAEQMNPHSVRTLRARGAVYIAENQQSKAHRYFERAFELDEKDPKTLSGLGMCYMHAKQTRKAYECFVSALSEAPDSLVAILQLLECSYTLGKYDDLVKILRNYLEINPADIEMQFCLAGALYKQGVISEAQKILNAVLAQNSEHSGAAELLEFIANEVAGSNKAIPSGNRIDNQVETSVVSKPFSELDMKIESEISRIEELKNKKQLEQAELECQALLKNPGLTPEQVYRVECLIAELEMLSGRLEQADTRIKALLSKNPDYARAYVVTGTLAALAENWTEAEANFKKSYEIDAKQDRALAGLGLCEAARGDRDQAWEYYRKALETNPENKRALLGVIEIGYPLQRYSEIENALSMYLELHPGDTEFLYSLAGCFYVQGKIGEAAKEVAKISLLSPEHEGAKELDQMISEKKADLEAGL